MAVTGIESARHKLDRAAYHVADLAARVEVFTEEHPIEVHALWQPSTTHPGEVDCQAIAVTEPSDVPEVWSLITGDALTCIRAALDHAVYPHAWQFQILLSAVDQKGNPVVPKPVHSPAVTAVIEQCQPYHWPSAHHQPLGVLTELVNEDKHRQLLVTNGFSAQIQIVAPDGYAITHEDPQSGANLEKGSVITRFRLAQTGVGPFEFQYQKHLRVTPVIDIPKTTDYRELIPELQTIHRYVTDVVDQLEAAGLS
ncbi:hypothetical protein [Nocardia sp. NPDC051832]|uniref:hypothetical protein n=1 Tax=Nocardia sp. NPDC051832 TaxID=3155673 RepID=UPI00343BB710